MNGYVATDLEIRAPRRLHALADALTIRAGVVYRDETQGDEGWVFRMPAAESSFGAVSRASVERDVSDLVAALERLGDAARDELRRASQAAIDVAFQSDGAEHAFSLSSELLARVAASGASVVVTVYAAEREQRAIGA